MERKRMVANERDALMDLALIVELVLSAEEGLEKRSRVIKGTRKWMGLLSKVTAEDMCSKMCYRSDIYRNHDNRLYGEIEVKEDAID